MNKQFCVLGNPIAHSLSPKIHQLFAKECGLTLSYTKILVQNNFAQTLKDLKNQGLTGANVTIPLKEQAFLLSDEKSHFALQAQSANTLFFKDNKILAFNTDGLGFLLDLKKRLHLEIKNKNVLILGAGGASRALIAPILSENPKTLFLSNRNIQKAHHLAGMFPISVLPWENLEQTSTAFDLVINATSSSLLKQNIPIPPFASNAYFYDLFYSSNGNTFFLESAKEKGAQNTSDGLGMLVFQAALSFEIWHGILPNALNVYAILKK